MSSTHNDKDNERNASITDFIIKPEIATGDRPKECRCETTSDDHACWYCCIAARKGRLEFIGEINNETGRVYPPKPAIKPGSRDNEQEQKQNNDDRIESLEDLQNSAAEFDVEEERSPPEWVRDAGISEDGEHLSIQMLADPPEEYLAEARADDQDDIEDNTPAGPEDLPDWLPVEDVPELPDDPDDRVCDECGAIGFWEHTDSHPAEAGWRDPDPDDHDPGHLEASDSWECADPDCHSKSFDHRKTKTPAFRCMSPHCGNTEFDAPRYCGPVEDRARNRLLWVCGHCDAITLGPWSEIPAEYWDDITP